MWQKEKSDRTGGFYRFGTAYRSRTDDLLRERQLSWTTRRMRQLSILNSEFRIVKFRIQLSKFKIIHRNRLQKYNYFLNNQSFYEKKFDFHIISLKIRYAINAVLRTLSIARQHLQCRIFQKMT